MKPEAEGNAMNLPRDCLSQLQAAGLLVSEHVFPAHHVAYPDGHVICKPEGIDAPSTFNAPRVIVHAERGKWVVTVREGIPLPGPGDFVDEWDTPEQAVEDVLDYYFGNPDRLLVKRRAWEAELRRQAHTPDLVPDLFKVLQEAATEGNLPLTEQVVRYLLQLVEFGADAEALRQAVRVATVAAHTAGHRAVVGYLESIP
jgi:hypothetical protein